jgi:bacterioferritin
LEEKAGQPGQDSELPKEFLKKMQEEITSKYTEMLQHIRTSWIFQKNGIIGWKIMDQAMKKMRHLAHFSEPIAEDGMPPQFKPGQIAKNDSIEAALMKAVEDVKEAQERHRKMQEDSEVKKHSGLIINLDMTVQQEEYQRAEIEDWQK